MLSFFIEKAQKINTPTPVILVCFTKDERALSPVFRGNTW